METKTEMEIGREIMAEAGRLLETLETVRDYRIALVIEPLMEGTEIVAGFAATGDVERATQAFSRTTSEFFRSAFRTAQPLTMVESDRAALTVAGRSIGTVESLLRDAMRQRK